MRQRIIENTRIRLRYAHLFGDHQRVEMIAQAGAFKADLLKRGKAVGNDPKLHLPFQRIQQRNGAGQRRADIRHRIQEGLVQHPRTHV